MAEYLKLKKSNCVNCYKCVRHCPVKSIKYSTGQAQIVSDECILCGQCFVVCPQNAKEIRNDVPSAIELLKSGPVIASVAPSFVANYPGATIATMEKALKQLGFTAAEETAVGASIVKTEYENIIHEGKQEVIISTCCHSVNTLVEKYYPEVLPYLATVLSPMQAHCQKIKQEHPGVKTVFIGPCISKKAEAEAYPGTVDCVLTFEELSDWLKQEGVSIEQGEDHLEESRARLFTDWGLSRGMEGICPTLLAAMGSRFERIPFFYDDFSVRLMTPRECARLQGFPESFILPKENEKQVYKQIGNSVCVPVVSRIAENIVKALN